MAKHLVKIKSLEISRTGLNEKEMMNLGIPYKTSIC